MNKLQRLDNNRLKILNDFGIDVTLYANQEIPIEKQAVEDLIYLLGVKDTLSQILDKSPDFFGNSPMIQKVVITPDFHKGSVIPIGTVIATQGFVIPQAIGNDVNCGMRLNITSIKASDINKKLDDLENLSRHIFFEGGRNIPMNRIQREAILREGIIGLLMTTDKSLRDGIWSAFHSVDIEDELDRIHSGGGFSARNIFGLQEFAGRDELHRDSQIGSIGGGNHFVEFQSVERIFDGKKAYAWGLKEGYVVVMVHSGSVSIGHLCGGHFVDLAQHIYPENLKHPKNGVFVIPEGGKHGQGLSDFMDSMYNAANFAFVNRLFLGLMALSCLKEIFGETEFRLLYDSPHNLVWEQNIGGKKVFLHRKGACPARGIEDMTGTHYEYYGEPVLVPGSMGSSSFVLSGLGNKDALMSASHGAGRSLSRGKALHVNEEEFKEFLDKFRVVTPIDFKRVDIKQRKDILEKQLMELKKEAPFAYKSITPVINTLSESGIAKPVAELKPIMTLKGF